MRFRKIIFAIVLTLSFLGINASAARGEKEKTTPQSFAPPAYEYESLTSQPEPAEYWQQVGANAVLVGDYPNALAALNKAVDLSGASNPEVLEQRGWVHYRLGNERLASADLRAAAALYLADQSYKDYLNARNMLMFVDS